MSKTTEEKLISVPEFVKTRVNRYNKPVSPQSVYQAIKKHKNGGNKPDFEYVDKGRLGIWIVSEKEPVKIEKIISAKVEKKNGKPVAKFKLEVSTKPVRLAGEDTITYAGRVSEWKKSLNKK